MTEAAQEVSKEVSSQASTAAWATTKPGNYNIRHLIQASREGKISWDAPAKKILAKINGLYPYPGAWFIFKGERYKILKAEISDKSGEPGKVLSENYEIGCLDRSIKVLEIQREGKKVQKITEFSLGTEIKKNTYL